MTLNALNWRWQSFHRRFWRSKVQSFLWTKEYTKQWLFLDVMAYLQLFDGSQNLKYDNFVYQLTHRVWNVLHHWRKFCSKSCRPQPVVQTPSPRIYDVVNGELASVVSWTLYDRRCRCKCKIRHNVRKTHTWHIRFFDNSFTFNSDIFSETSETMIHLPFNICNHSRLFKFLHNFGNCLRSWKTRSILLTDGL